MVTELRFQELMTIASDIVGHGDYKPPSTPYELAALINAWALSQVGK
jgi:hypothetical protein